MSNKYICLVTTPLGKEAKAFKDNCYEIEPVENEALHIQGFDYKIIFYNYDEPACDSYYLDEKTVKNNFRPFNHKKLVAKCINSIDSLNEFLATINPDDVREIKDCQISWTVFYIDWGDDER